METERAGLDGLTTYTLANGLQVLLKETHVAPVASLWVFYRVGSRNESPGLTGVSHWVEHMLFKGTPAYPRGEFDRAVARAGGQFNGMTWQDWTTYFESFPAERIELALQVESDRMANALFDPDETESERTVIIAEREGSENSFVYRLQEELSAVAFSAHPYRNPVIGWKTDLLTMTREDLYRHYRTFYTPNNAVLVIAGDFETAAMQALVETYFGPLPAGPAVPAMRIREPEGWAERRLLLQGDDPTPFWTQSYRAPAALHPDFFPMVVADAVLGGAKGLGLFGGSANARATRLYRALVDAGLAVDAGSSYLPALDENLFSFSATPAPDVDPAAVEAAVLGEIERLKQEPVAEAELRKAIKQMRAQFAFGSESVTWQAYWLGFSAVVTSLEWLATWDARLSAVTPDDVQRVAQTYFVANRRTTGLYLPDPSAFSDDLNDNTDDNTDDSGEEEAE